MSKTPKTEKMVVPVLPLREVIVFPHMVVPLFVGREKSIHALEECVEKKKELFLVAQKQATTVNLPNWNSWNHSSNPQAS